MRSPPLVALYIALTCLFVTHADAQVVGIRNGENEQGFGWMFRHADLCHVILPRHVAGQFPRVTIKTAGPVEFASGTVVTPFWPGIDLAIAIVRGAIQDRCLASLEDLRSIPFRTGGQPGHLVRLLDNGTEERLPLVLGSRSYLTFEGHTTAPGDHISQGTSGAFAFVGDTPVGMAITSAGTDRATFMRSEEIVLNVRRFLAEQSRAYAGLDAPAPPPATPGNTLRVNAISATMPPASPLHAPESLLEGGTFIFHPAARMILDLELATRSPVPVRQLILHAETGAGQSRPGSILLQYSPEASGGNFREWARIETGLDGIADTRTIYPRNMRRIRLIILSLQGEGPVALTGLEVR